MKQKFPMLAAWIHIRRINANDVEIINDLTGKSFRVGEANAYVNFITSLDGKTDPFEIPAEFSEDERFQILNGLSDFFALRQGRWLNRSFINLMYSVFLPKKHESNRRIFDVLNKMIYLTFLPILVCGIIFYYDSNVYISGFNVPGFICGILLGTILHEAAHAVSSICYGGKIYEAGVGTNFIFPVAYVLSKENDDLAPHKKIQVFSAGIEMNAIVSGISFILGWVFYYSGDFFYYIAITNIMLMLINLVLIREYDGYKILSVLFKEDDVVDIAKGYVITREKRKQLLKQGFIGRVRFFSCCIILFFQMAMLALIILSIGVIIKWII